MILSTMAGLTKRCQGIIMYFIRCPRHSPTKMMFYIKFLMASSSMTSVEEEAVTGVPGDPSCVTEEREDSFAKRGLPWSPSIQSR